MSGPNDSADEFPDVDQYPSLPPQFLDSSQDFSNTLTHSTTATPSVAHSAALSQNTAPFDSADFSRTVHDSSSDAHLSGSSLAQSQPSTDTSATPTTLSSSTDFSRSTNSTANPQLSQGLSIPHTSTVGSIPPLPSDFPDYYSRNQSLAEPTQRNASSLFSHESSSHTENLSLPDTSTGSLPPVPPALAHDFDLPAPPHPPAQLPDFSHEMSLPPLPTPPPAHSNSLSFPDTSTSSLPHVPAMLPSDPVDEVPAFAADDLPDRPRIADLDQFASLEDSQQFGHQDSSTNSLPSVPSALPSAATAVPPDSDDQMISSDRLPVMASSISQWEQQATHGLENEERKLAQMTDQAKTTVADTEINPEFDSIKSRWGEVATTVPLPDRVIKADELAQMRSDNNILDNQDNVHVPDASSTHTSNPQTSGSVAYAPDPATSAPLTNPVHSSGSVAYASDSATSAPLANPLHSSGSQSLSATDPEQALQDIDIPNSSALSNAQPEASNCDSLPPQDNYAGDHESFVLATSSVNAPSSGPFVSGSMDDASASFGDTSGMVASDVTDDDSNRGSSTDEDPTLTHSRSVSIHEPTPGQRLGQESGTLGQDLPQEDSDPEPAYDEPLKVLASADLADREPTATIRNHDAHHRFTQRTERVNIRVPDVLKATKRSAKGPNNISAFTLGTNIKVSKKNQDAKYTGLLIRQSEGKLVDLSWSDFTSNDDRLYALAASTNIGKAFLYFIWVTNDSVALLRECCFAAKGGTHYSKINFIGTPLSGSLALVPENDSGLRVVSFKSAAILPEIEATESIEDVDDDTENIPIGDKTPTDTSANETERPVDPLLANEGNQTIPADLVGQSDASANGVIVPPAENIRETTASDPTAVTNVDLAPAANSDVHVDEGGASVSNTLMSGTGKSDSHTDSGLEEKSDIEERLSKGWGAGVGSGLDEVPKLNNVGTLIPADLSGIGNSSGQTTEVPNETTGALANLSKSTGTSANLSDVSKSMGEGKKQYMEKSLIDIDTHKMQAANPQEVSDMLGEDGRFEDLVNVSGSLVGQDAFVDVLDSDDVPRTVDFTQYPPPPVPDPLGDSGELAAMTGASMGDFGQDFSVDQEVASTSFMSMPPPPPAPPVGFGEDGYLEGEGNSGDLSRLTTGDTFANMPPPRPIAPLGVGEEEYLDGGGNSGNLSRLNTGDSVMMEAPAPPTMPSFRY